MVGLREVLLHLLELGRPDVGVGVLLAVDHAGLHRDEQLGELERRRVGAIGLEHLDPPDAGRRAQLDALEVLGRVDRAHVVGDLAEAVLPHADQLVALLLELGRELRPDDLLRDAAHVRPVLDQVGHVEQAELGQHGRHDGRGLADLERAEADLLQHLGVVAELARAVDVGLDLVADLLVDALDPFVARQVLHAARRVGGAEADLDLVLRARRTRGQQGAHRGAQPDLRSHGSVLPDVRGSAARFAAKSAASPWRRARLPRVASSRAPRDGLRIARGSAQRGEGTTWREKGADHGGTGRRGLVQAPHAPAAQPLSAVRDPLGRPGRGDPSRLAQGAGRDRHELPARRRRGRSSRRRAPRSPRAAPGCASIRPGSRSASGPCRPPSRCTRATPSAAC